MIEIVKSPEQEIFDYFYAFSLYNHYSTFDYLPTEDVDPEYPFVYIGDVQGISGGTKSSLNGSVVINIDVWGTHTQRLVVSNMVNNFYHRAVGHITSKNYRFFGNLQGQSKQIIIDTTVPRTVLIRGILSLRLDII